MYTIRYSPLAREDLTKIIDYITDTLQNPKAAYELVDSIDQAAARLASFPHSARVYKAPQPLDDEIRVLPVKNYLIFYTVLESTVEVRRILYGRSDISAILL